MGLFDSLRNAFSRKNMGSFWGGFKKGFGGVFNTLKKGKDWIGGAYNKIKNIPVIGNLVDSLAGMPIPKFGGLSVKDMANMGGKAVDIGSSVNEGIQRL